MEDMRAIAVDSHSVTILAIEVTTHLTTVVDNLHALTCLNGTPSHHRTEESRADDKVVVRSFILIAQHSLGMKSGGQGAPADA